MNFMRHFSICFIFIIFVNCSSLNRNINKLDSPFRFLDLKNNKYKIEIEYSNIGCFHFIEKIFIFKGGRNPHVIEYKAYRNYKNNRIYFKSKIGSLSLSNDDLKKIDNLFNYYRSIENTGSCTDIEYLKVTYKYRTKKVFHENFEDSRCYDLGDDILELLEISAMIEEN